MCEIWIWVLSWNLFEFRWWSWLTCVLECEWGSVLLSLFSVQLWTIFLFLHYSFQFNSFSCFMSKKTSMRVFFALSNLGECYHWRSEWIVNCEMLWNWSSSCEIEVCVFGLERSEEPEFWIVVTKFSCLVGECSTCWWLHETYVWSV